MLPNRFQMVLSTVHAAIVNLSNILTSLIRLHSKIIGIRFVRILPLFRTSVRYLLIHCQLILIRGSLTLSWCPCVSHCVI
jgi:hypothetical protein